MKIIFIILIMSIITESIYLKKKAPFYFIAVKYHKTHKNKPISFLDHQYLLDIYLDESPDKVIKKSTQCGISEMLIITAIGSTTLGLNVFYVLPTGNLQTRFVRNRFDLSIEYTPYYRSLIGQGLKKFAESVSLKHIGDRAIAFVGSNATAGFTEFPADILIIDELDECNQDNIEMAPERLSASEYRYIINVGNPTIDNYGIDNKYQESDQKKWFIKCDHCNHYFNPDFFLHVVEKIDENVYVIRDRQWKRNMVRDIHIICDKCGKPVNRFKEGEWIAQEKSSLSGYHISKLFSTKITIEELVESFNKGLTNDTKLQRFYNGDLGLAFTSFGSKISSETIDKCIQSHLNFVTPKYPTVMGVDVGKALHVRINEIIPSGEKRAVYVGEVRELDDLINLFREYNVVCAVIDALPETRMAKAFSTKFPGKVFRCFFGTEKKDIIDAKHRIVTVDRTQMLDSVKEDFLLKKILLPANIKSVEGYYEQLQSSTRVWDEDKEKYSWIKGTTPDHYFLTEGYANVALRILKLIRS